jgi:hypothetical protein
VKVPFPRGRFALVVKACCFALGAKGPFPCGRFALMAKAHGFVAAVNARAFNVKVPLPSRFWES